MTGLRALLVLRGTLLWRRHGTPFDAIVLALTLGGGWVAGRTLGREVPEAAGPAAGLLALALFASLGAGLAFGAYRLLYRARELALLLAQPVGERALVVARLVELVLSSALILAVGAAVLGGAGERVSILGVTLAVLLGGLLLGASGLLGAWGFASWARAWPRAVRATSGVLWLTGAGVFLAALASPHESRAVARALALALDTPLQPGASFVALVRGLDPVAFGALALEAAFATGLALALVPRGLGAAIDAASARPSSERGLAYRIAGLVAAPLPGPARALVRRDLALLARGAFPRGLLVLALLPLGLLVFREATLDKKLAQENLVELAALFVEGLLASVAAFLFAVDYPRERAPRLVWERAQPLSGRHVLWARAYEAALPSVALALALGAIAAFGPPQVADDAPRIALACTLLGLLCAHHGAAFGLEMEGTGGEIAAAAGFPMAAGFLAVAGALALGITDATSGFPWGAGLYLVVYRGLGARAAQSWERAEVARG